ncbi:hypothetical protein Dimus_014102 [Dionaea muscipula]
MQKLILAIGTKLHRIVVKLAVEIMDSDQWMETHELNLRDELFWFGKPWFLLRLIQFISFQNALEMATFLWSLVSSSACFYLDKKNPLPVILNEYFYHSKTIYWIKVGSWTWY